MKAKPKIEGLSPKELLDKLTRRKKPKPTQSKGWGTDVWRNRPISISNATIEQLLDALQTKALISGLTPKRLEKKLDVLNRDFEKGWKAREKQAEIKRKEAEIGLKQQQRPFYRFGLMIAYKGHLSQHGRNGEKLLKEIRGYSKDAKMSILKRLKNGEIPESAENHRHHIPSAIEWLTTEIIALR